MTPQTHFPISSLSFLHFHMWIPNFIVLGLCSVSACTHLLVIGVVKVICSLSKSMKMFSPIPILCITPPPREKCFSSLCKLGLKRIQQLSSFPQCYKHCFFPSWYFLLWYRWIFFFFRRAITQVKTFVSLTTGGQEWCHTVVSVQWVWDQMVQVLKHSEQ